MGLISPISHFIFLLRIIKMADNFYLHENAFTHLASGSQIKFQAHVLEKVI